MSRPKQIYGDDEVSSERNRHRMTVPPGILKKRWALSRKKARSPAKKAADGASLGRKDVAGRERLEEGSLRALE